MIFKLSSSFFNSLIFFIDNSSLNKVQIHLVSNFHLVSNLFYVLSALQKNDFLMKECHCLGSYKFFWLDIGYPSLETQRRPGLLHITDLDTIQMNKWGFGILDRIFSAHFKQVNSIRKTCNLFVIKTVVDS